ncbi:MAG: SpoVA/SpoVAEb family sporulation membrane protein [Oscillospiraceae bacterium]|jgi:stage V sporulation protein AC|nr:SpoVA/SpoVAEb family sporulation membrane protein [Oscillospiraceae bacterium]
MQTSREDYKKMVKKATPPSAHVQHWILSFLVGGAICALGQGIRLLCEAQKVDEETIRIIVPCALVALSALLTALGLFDKIGKFAGAGSAVPITGFANSIVSSAMEHRCEGLVLGVGANMFKLAGPVLAYGTAVCTIYGLLYLIFQ